MVHTVRSRLSIALFCTVFSTVLAPSAAEPTKEEVLSSATAKGKLVVDDYLSRAVAPNSSSYNYFDACSYYGACLYAEAVKDVALFDKVYNKYKNSKPSSIPTGDVDKNSNGLIPLYLSVSKNDESLLSLGKAAADASLQNKGYPRYAIDDTYMTGSLMVQAYRATKDMKYLDFCAEYITKYKDTLLQPDGLYWHKLDSKNYWGRGNGWGAASSTELLLELPKTHVKYESVLAGYQKHMKGLLAKQQTSGMWMQLIGSTDTNNWVESSGTAMFLFAMLTGLRNGWLEEDTFLEPAKRGWMALAGYLQGAKLTNVAAGFWPSTGQPSDYINASKGQPGDPHGTAAFLWAASAAIQLFTPVGTHAAPVLSHTQYNPAGTSALLGGAFDLQGRTLSTSTMNAQKAGVPMVIVQKKKAEVLQLR